MANSNKKLVIDRKVSELTVTVELDQVAYILELDTSFKAKKDFAKQGKVAEKLKKEVGKLNSNKPVESFDMVEVSNTFDTILNLYKETLDLIVVNKDVLKELDKSLADDVIVYSQVYEFIVAEFNKHGKQQANKINKNKGKGK